MTLEQVQNGSLHNLMVLIWRCIVRHSLKVEYFLKEWNKLTELVSLPLTLRGAEKQDIQMDAMSQEVEQEIDNNLQHVMVSRNALVKNVIMKQMKLF